MSDVDLTCPECEGSGEIRLGTEELGDDLACLRCGGVGRRSFTMHEWDALVAERDELDGIVSAYHDATGCLPEDASALRAERDELRAELEQIVSGPPSNAWARARAALDRGDGR